MTATAAPVQVRGSWGRLAFGLFAFLFAWSVPQFRALLPIEQTALLVVPAFAVCALLGWKQGGKPWLALAAIALSAWLLYQGVGPADSAYGWLARGWAVVIAASFGLVGLFVPGEAFFPRALGAMAIATALGFSLVLASPGGAPRVANMMASELNRRNDESLAQARAARNQAGVKEAVDSSRTLQWLTEESERQIAAIPKWASILLPALLALESLIAMALAWAAYRRLGDAAIGPPLGPLREFRFNDQLVWGVAVGASIYLLPAFTDGRNAGLNLLVFFSVLYVLRGVGILSWMARGPLVRAMLVVLALVAMPVVTALALGLGLGDTWLDWRTRAQVKSP